jgi:alkylhydroperoxidase family enzyme
MGRHAGLSNEEMALNRPGGSSDTRAAAIVAFARALNERLGEVTPGQFAAARTAGLSDAEIVEIIAVVALNVFTNILGKATQVDIDFPKVALLGAPVAA